MDRAIVTIRTPSGDAYDFRVGRDRFTVGRGAECELTLPAAEVSSRHAEFDVDATSGAAHVTDLGSKNGTFVGGQLIPANTPVLLTPDTEIRIATVEMRVRPFRDEDRSQSLSLETSLSLSRSLLRGLLGEAVRQNRARLEVLAGPSEGAVYALDERVQRVRLGVGQEVELDLAESRMGGLPILILLDGHHYKLVPSEGLKLRVNRTRVVRSLRLCSGDTIRFLSTTIRFVDPLQSAIDGLDVLDQTDDAFTRPVAKMVRGDAPQAALGRGAQAAGLGWSLSERLMFGFAVLSLLAALGFLLVVLDLIELG